jgi:hypothetical protein
MRLSRHLRLFDKAASGQLGAEAYYALVGIAQAKVAAVKQPMTTEQLNANSAPQHQNDSSRRQRLAELLRRRETTETATGSLSPNPPHGDS